MRLTHAAFGLPLTAPRAPAGALAFRLELEFSHQHLLARLTRIRVVS